MATPLQDFLGAPPNAEVDKMNHELNVALLNLETRKTNGANLEAYLADPPFLVRITDTQKERMRESQRVSIVAAENEITMAKAYLAQAESRNKSSPQASTAPVQTDAPDKISEATVKMVDDGVVKEKVLADPGGTIGAADIADAAGEVAGAEPSNMSSALNNLAQAKADALTGKAQAKLTGAVNSIQGKIDGKMKGVNSFVGAVNGKINAANSILGKRGGNTKASASVDTTAVTAQDANDAGAGIKTSTPDHVYALFNKSDLNDKVIFTVMPQVSESRTVSYESVQPAQFPGAFHKYKGTESTTYTISAVFASSTPYQAGKNLENLRRLKSWTMPFFGDNVPKGKLGAPPPVLLFRGLRGAVGEVPVVITSLSYDWPKDVDYIKAQGSKGDTPFPAIMTVSISVVESFSVAEFNGFDLAAFANGDMANAFKAVVPAVSQNGTTDTALAQDATGANGRGLGGSGALGAGGLGSVFGAAPLSIGDIRSIGGGTGSFDNISGLTGPIAGDGVSRIGSGFARGSFAEGAGLTDTHLASPGMIAGALSDPRREEAFNGGRQFNPSINVFGQGAFTPTFESLSRVDPRDEARKASKQMIATMFQEPLSSATELKFAGKK